MSATVGDTGVCFLITLNKTNISTDAALEPFVFLFSSIPLFWSMILLPLLKFLSFGMSFVFSGSPLSTPLSAFKPYPYMASDKGFFLMAFCFSSWFWPWALPCVSIGHTQWILPPIRWPTPALHLTAVSFFCACVTLLIDYLIFLLSRVPQLYFFSLFQDLTGNSKFWIGSNSGRREIRFTQIATILPIYQIWRHLVVWGINWNIKIQANMCSWLSLV